MKMPALLSPGGTFMSWLTEWEETTPEKWPAGLQSVKLPAWSMKRRWISIAVRKRYLDSYIRMNSAYIANIGDSRAYLFRSGKLGQITRDHTYVNELIDKGVITEDEAEHHEQKNVITKALGTEHLAGPDFYKVDLESNDILLLCSDGLYGEVPAERIAEILETDQNMNDMCNTLVKEALAAGGRDNITVICLKI